MLKLTRWVTLACALGLPAAASAQVATGRIVDHSGQPLSGASGVLVQLLNAGDSVVAQVLANRLGEYRLAAGAPGTYRVRTLRIGFLPAVSEPVRLGAGETVPVPALASGAGVALDTVRVRDRNECRNVRDAAATFALWEQARTALTVVGLGGRERVGRTTTLTFRQTLSPLNDEVREQIAQIGTGFFARPWLALPVDSLRKVGYIVTDDRGWRTYYAPDLNVLLDPTFVQDHCFRLAEDGERADSDSGSVGLAFEPRDERRGVAAILGTLWLDRRTSELRRLDFRYTNVSTEEERARAGGEVEFGRLANGLWIISWWTVRMPVLAQRQELMSSSGRGMRNIVEVSSIRLEGGAVALVVDGTDTLFTGRSSYYTGVVVDSATARGIPGTRLALRGTTIEERTDSLGAFTMTNVLPGQYTLDVRTPRLDALGTSWATQVTIVGGALVDTIRVPDAAVVARNLCPNAPGGIVAGRVQAGDVVAPNAWVVAEWQEQAGDRRTRWLETRADGRGHYRVCGAPLDVQITLRARTDSTASGEKFVRLANTYRLATTDLILDRPTEQLGILAGVVMSDVNSAPIIDVEVSIPSLSKVTYTDAEGRFRLGDIPAGSHQVLLRRLAWEPRTATIAFGAGERVDRRFLLSRVQLLDTVAVVESELPMDFVENQKLGLGRFMTRAELARFDGGQMAQALRSLGVRINSSASGTGAWVTGGRYTTFRNDSGTCRELENATSFDGKMACACYANVWVDGVRVYDGSEGGIVPNINRIPPETIEAIEYYRGAAQIPMKYTGLNTQCGVIVIHTRRYRAGKGDKP